MSTRTAPPEADAPVFWRIGEAAKLTGVTPRTLRYWDEMGLLRPSSCRDSGERLYLASDLARISRIRKLQELLGLSLEEIRTVLATQAVDVLDRVRSEIDAGELSSDRRRDLLEQAIEANDRLLARLDDTLARIGAFREERVDAAIRLREALDDHTVGNSIDRA